LRDFVENFILLRYNKIWCLTINYNGKNLGAEIMKVAICDDEVFFRYELRKLLIRYDPTSKIISSIDEFSDGGEILKSENEYDIIFLDYQMTTTTGMETARALRRKNCTSALIFATSFPQYAVDAFEVNAFRYLIKPVSYDKLKLAIDDYIKTMDAFTNFKASVDGKISYINSKDVMYFEAVGKSCVIRLKDSIINRADTLANVIKEFPQEYFYRVHRTYVVNLFYIDSIKDYEITFVNGEKATISKRNFHDFIKAYKNFLFSLTN
jgi:DNA-binding LytR/AlgR family response regulator